MNLALIGPWLRALLSLRVVLLLAGGLVIATYLALEPLLAPQEQVGAYIAYVALVPALLLLRFGAVLDARRRDGLEIEERLRDPAGHRALTSALLGAWLALALALAAGALAAMLRPDAGMVAPPARHPVRVYAGAAGAYAFDARGAVPAGSALVLTIAWERAPAGDIAPALLSADGRRLALAPGAAARWLLSAEERRAGRVELGMNDPAREAGAVPIRPLARLEVPRPDRAALPRLFARQFLFHAPLFPLVLLLVRRGRAGGLLAACAALGLAGLLAYDPRAETLLPEGPLGWIARTVLGLKQALPDLRGLAAAGHGYELRSGTTPLAAIGTWWLIGAAAAILARPGGRRA